ncbi:DUF3857 domain-containing transglutaminase family protein [bacterium]|nr:DUF3857 domain-containing transglutaminase family protein [bacterium]
MKNPTSHFLKSTRISVFLLFFLFFISEWGNAALIDFADGKTLTIASLSCDENKVFGIAGTESFSVPREMIRDISFSTKDREADVLATYVSDIKPLFEKAQKLMGLYPDSTSVLVLDDGQFRYRPDGTNLYLYRAVIFLAKEESLGAAEVNIGFEPTRQRVRVIHARTLNSDGSVGVLSPDQIKIAKGSSGEVYFDQYQQLSFTIPDAHVGGMIDYCYELEEFNPVDKLLFQSHFTFQGTDPVGDSILRVYMPKDVPLYYVSPNCREVNSKPVVSSEKDETLYTWKMSDMPPIIPEPAMPSLSDVAPSVAFCLQKDWGYMFKRLKPMFEKRFVLTDSVKKKVDEIISGAKTLEEKISKIYLFCQKEIRYISIKGNLSSNQVGHPAEDTLKNRYGDCTDKGMLLSTMLKHIGVEAYPVGIKTNPSGKAIRELPIFDSDHCITEVHLNGRRFYLDSTATDYRYPYFRADDHDTLTENAMLERLDPVPLPPPEDNALLVKREISLSEDGTARVSFDSESNGPAEASMRGSTRNLKPEEYEKSVRASIAALTADYVLEIATHSDPLDFSTAFQVKSAYTLKKFAPRSGRFMIFQIPYIKLNFPEVSLKERKYDLVRLTSNLRKEDVNIKLPQGFSVRFLPAPLSIKTPFVEFDAKYVRDSDSIKFSSRISFPNRIVPVVEYKNHQENLERIAKFTDERIFMEKISQIGEKK